MCFKCWNSIDAVILLLCKCTVLQHKIWNFFFVKILSIIKQRHLFLCLLRIAKVWRSVLVAHSSRSWLWRLRNLLFHCNHVCFRTFLFHASRVLWSWSSVIYLRNHLLRRSRLIWRNLTTLLLRLDFLFARHLTYNTIDSCLYNAGSRLYNLLALRTISIYIGKTIILSIFLRVVVIGFCLYYVGVFFVVVNHVS